MPRLGSGRNVGVSPGRLLDWAEHRAHGGDYLRMAVDNHQPGDLWADIDVVHYDSDGSSCPDTSPDPGEPYLAGFTVADVIAGRCEWSEQWIQRRERSRLQSERKLSE